MSFLLLPSLLILPGCAVDHGKEAALYRGILDAGTADVRSYEPGEPLSLDRALGLANRHNEQLAIQGEDYVQALIAKDRAFAAFLPTISVAPTFNFVDNGSGGGSSSFVIPSGGTSGGGGTVDGGGGTVVDGGGGGTSTGGFVVSGGGSSRAHTFSVPVTGRLNVFNGFRDVAALRGTEATIEQRRALLRDLQATVLLEVAQTYFAALRAERSAEVLENSLAVKVEQVRLVRAQAAKEIVGPLEVAQSLADESATRVLLTQARTDAWNARAALALLMGVDAFDGPLADVPEAVPPVLELEPLLRLAGDHRQDLLATRSAIEAARQNVAVAVNAYYPSISLNFNQILHRDPDPSSWWTGAVSANLPLFTGGQIRADVRTAWSQFRQAVEQQSLVGRQVVRDVTQARHNLIGSTSKVRDLQAQVDAALTALKLSNQRYRLGTISNLDRLIVENQALDAELQLATESFNQRLFQLDLERAIGRLGPNTPATLRAAAATRPVSRPVSGPTTLPGVGQ